MHRERERAGEGARRERARLVLALGAGPVCGCELPPEPRQTGCSGFLQRLSKLPCARHRVKLVERVPSFSLVLVGLWSFGHWKHRNAGQLAGNKPCDLEEE